MKDYKPYLIVAVILLVVVVYVAIPKPAPEATIEITQVQVMDQSPPHAQIAVSAVWKSDIQPTYVTVDVLPIGAPDTILPADRDKYYLIRLPHKWINTNTVYTKEGDFSMAYLVDMREYTEFKVVIRLKNDDIKDFEHLAIDTEQFSLAQPTVG